MARSVCPAVESQNTVGQAGLPKNLPDLLARNERAWNTLDRYDLHSAIESDGNLEIIFHYGREPVLYPKTEMIVRITLGRDEKTMDSAEIKLAGPKAWTIVEKSPGTFGIRSETVEKNGYLTVKVKVRSESRTYSARFVLLSPEQVTGWNGEVQRCPVCSARKGACLCRKS